MFRSKRVAVAIVLLGVAVFLAGYITNQVEGALISGDLGEAAGTGLLVLGACLFVRILIPTSYITYLLYSASSLLVFARTLDVTEEIAYLNGLPIIGHGGWAQSHFESGFESAGYILVLLTLLALMFELAKLKEAAERAHFEWRLLHEKSLHLARIADMSVEAVIGVGRSGRIQTLNAGACMLFGYSEHEAVGLPLQTFFRSRLSFDGHSIVEHVLSGRTVQDVDLSGVSKSRNEIALAATFSPVVGDDGEVVGVSAVIRDIAKRKRAERELIDSKKLLAGALHSANVGMFVLTEHEGMLEYNARMEEISGFTFDEIKEQGIDETLNRSVDVSERLTQRIRKQVLEEGRALDFRNLRITRKDGSERLCNLSLVPVFDEEEKAIAVAGVAVDITEREALQNKLLESQKLESVGRLAGGVAHDFNNILGGILGYATLMADTVDRESPVYNYARAIETAALRAAELTRQLLTFARSGKFKQEAVDLNVVIQETLKLLDSSLAPAVSVSVELGAALCHIAADRSQMEQVLMNLCLNSRDALQDQRDARIVVRTRNVRPDAALLEKLNLTRPGDYVCLSVEDNGCGIEPALTQKIFDPFFTTKKQGEGYGLGLSVVYGVVENHHGGLLVRSTPNQGTCIEVYFPAARPDTPLPQKARRPVRAVNVRGNETVLVVDDEKFMRALAHDILCGQGYRIVEAASGEEAVSLYHGGEPNVDLVVLDLLMPGMDGAQALDEIRKVNPDVRCIISSGFGVDQIDKKRLNGPFVRFVPKPYTATQLLTEVRELLDAAPK